MTNNQSINHTSFQTQGADSTKYQMELKSKDRKYTQVHTAESTALLRLILREELYQCSLHCRRHCTESSAIL